MPRLRTQMSTVKTSGVPAAKKQVCFARTGRYLVLGCHFWLGLKWRIEGQVAMSAYVGHVSPASSVRPFQ